MWVCSVGYHCLGEGSEIVDVIFSVHLLRLVIIMGEGSDVSNESPSCFLVHRRFLLPGACCSLKDV